MTTTVNALRALYAAFGGDAADVANLVTIPDIINALAALITDQGIAALPTGTDGQVLTLVSGDWAAANVPAELPTVSGDDDGKVLTVVDGNWAAATAG